MKYSHRKAAAVVVIIGAALSGQAGAQTMYRCGKQYQDRPCDAGQQGRAVGSATTSQPGKPVDAECSRRGERAMQMIWAREGGTTADDALARAGSAEDRQLVQDIYAKRGSSSQIRAAIEADCAAQKERDAQAAAMVKALGLPANTQPGQPQAEDPKAAEARRQRLAADEEAARKKQTCERLNADMQRNLASQRRGGTVAAMEKLSDERRDVSRKMVDAGC